MLEHAIDADATRSELSELVDRAARSGEVVMLTRQGEAVAKLVPLVEAEKGATAIADRDEAGADEGWTKLTRESFAFWDNDEDSIYDAL